MKITDSVATVDALAERYGAFAASTVLRDRGRRESARYGNGGRVHRVSRGLDEAHLK
jgi:hypothetical protein